MQGEEEDRAIPAQFRDDTFYTIDESLLTALLALPTDQRVALSASTMALSHLFMSQRHHDWAIIEASNAVAALTTGDNAACKKHLNDMISRQKMASNNFRRFYESLLMGLPSQNG